MWLSVKEKCGFNHHQSSSYDCNLLINAVISWFSCLGTGRQREKVSHRKGGKRAAVCQQKLQQKYQTQGGSLAHGSGMKAGAHCVWQLYTVSQIGGVGGGLGFGLEQQMRLLEAVMV